MNQKDYKEIAGINRRRLTYWEKKSEDSYNTKEIAECEAVIKELIKLFKFQADYFEREDINQATIECSNRKYKDRIQDYRKFSKVTFLKDCGVSK